MESAESIVTLHIFLENIKKMLAINRKQVYNLKCCVTLIAVKRRLPRRKYCCLVGFSWSECQEMQIG